MRETCEELWFAEMRRELMLKEEKGKRSAGRMVELGGGGSVLEQALVGRPRTRGEWLLAPGVLQLEQVAYFTDGPQCLAEAEVKGVLDVNHKPRRGAPMIDAPRASAQTLLKSCKQKLGLLGVK